MLLKTCLVAVVLLNAITNSLIINSRAISGKNQVETSGYSDNSAIKPIARAHRKCRRDSSGVPQQFFTPSKPQDDSDNIQNVEDLRKEVTKLRNLVQILRDQQYLLSLLSDVNEVDGKRHRIDSEQAKYRHEDVPEMKHEIQDLKQLIDQSFNKNKANDRESKLENEIQSQNEEIKALKKILTGLMQQKPTKTPQIAKEISESPKKHVFASSTTQEPQARVINSNDEKVVNDSTTSHVDPKKKLLDQLEKELSNLKSLVEQNNRSEKRSHENENVMLETPKMLLPPTNSPLFHIPTLPLPKLPGVLTPKPPTMKSRASEGENVHMNLKDIEQKLTDFEKKRNEPQRQNFESRASSSNLRRLIKALDDSREQREDPDDIIEDLRNELSKNKKKERQEKELRKLIKKIKNDRDLESKTVDDDDNAALERQMVKILETLVDDNNNNELAQGKGFGDTFGGDVQTETELKMLQKAIFDLQDNNLDIGSDLELGGADPGRNLDLGLSKLLNLKGNKPKVVNIKKHLALLQQLKKGQGYNGKGTAILGPSAVGFYGGPVNANPAFLSNAAGYSSQYSQFPVPSSSNGYVNSAQGSTPYAPYPFNRIYNNAGGLSSSYGNPAPNYGATFGNSASTYGNAVPSYANPSASYSSPSNNYGNSPSNYASSSSNYGNSPSSYGSPTSSYVNPSSSYGGSPASYGSLPSSYGNPPSSYVNPSASYGGSPSSYGSLSSSHGSSPSSYVNPSSNYVNPTINFPSAVPNYGAPPPNYNPALNYANPHPNSYSNHFFPNTLQQPQNYGTNYHENPVAAKDTYEAHYSEPHNYQTEDLHFGHAYAQKKVNDLRNQIDNLQGVINNLNRPEYTQQPEDKQMVYKLEDQIGHLKSVISNLNESNNGYQSAGSGDYSSVSSDGHGKNYDSGDSSDIHTAAPQSNPQSYGPPPQPSAATTYGSSQQSPSPTPYNAGPKPDNVAGNSSPGPDQYSAPNPAAQQSKNRYKRANEEDDLNKVMEILGKHFENEDSDEDEKNPFGDPINLQKHAQELNDKLAELKEQLENKVQPLSAPVIPAPTIPAPGVLALPQIKSAADYSYAPQYSNNYYPQLYQPIPYSYGKKGKGKKGLKDSKKDDIFDKIIGKILDKIISKIGKVIPRLIESLFGLNFNGGDYGGDYGVSYDSQNNFGGLFGFVPMIISKILSKITSFIYKLQKNKFLRSFLIPMLVVGIVAGLIIFLIWWLQPNYDYGNEYNYNDGGNKAYHGSGYNGDYNNNNYYNGIYKSSSSLPRDFSAPNNLQMSNDFHMAKLLPDENYRDVIADYYN